MLDFLEIGVLEPYRDDKIVYYVKYYGEACWMVNYQADVRFRYELLEEYGQKEEIEADRNHK